jgi:hypothetical protein
MIVVYLLRHQQQSPPQKGTDRQHSFVMTAALQQACALALHVLLVLLLYVLHTTAPLVH